MKAFEGYTIEELYDYTDMNIDNIEQDFLIKELEEEDYLNRNNNRNFDNTRATSYNCGGLALNTFNWYKPYEGAFEWREQLLVDWSGDYYDAGGELVDDPDVIIAELENRLLMRDVLYMLRQFKGRLRRVNGLEDLWAGERLIAYRIGVQYDYDVEENLFCDFDIDFHYRFYDDEKEAWVEKCGGGDIKRCEESDDTAPWKYFFWNYTSDVVYFALRLD
jgi:predicted RNA-binding protein